MPFMDTKGRMATVLGFDGTVTTELVYRDIDGDSYITRSLTRVYVRLCGPTWTGETPVAEWVVKS